MHILEITVPGSFLKIGEEGPLQCEENRRLLDFLTSQFYEANVSLNLFDGSSVGQQARQSLEEHRTDEEQKREMRAELTNGYLESDTDPDCQTQDQINFETEIRFKRAKWQNGQLPEPFLRLEATIHARAFIYALDAFGKTLKILGETPGCPGALSARHEEFLRSFPDLTSVSDSIQRVADRARGLRRERQSDPALVGNSPALNGETPALHHWRTTRYGITLENGHYGEVDVSLESMERLRNILQSTMDAFLWEGSQQHLPLQEG